MICVIDKCIERSHARGLCDTHNYRLKKYGDPLYPVKLGSNASPEERFWQSTNKTDTCWDWTGGKSGPPGRAYGVIIINKKRIKAHRFSYEMFVGPIPDKMQIDHTCFNKFCVNPKHLRLATNKQNGEHQEGPHPNNKTSNIRGVCWDQRRNKWAAYVTHFGKQYNLGSFDDIKEAEKAAIAKRKELFTHDN